VVATVGVVLRCYGCTSMFWVSLSPLLEELHYASPLT
jgi:hypothetical protein